MLSLPIYPKMTDRDATDVVAAVREVLGASSFPAGRYFEKGVSHASVPPVS